MAENEAVFLTQVERVLWFYLRGLLELQVATSGVAGPALRWPRFLQRLTGLSPHELRSASSYTDGVTLYLPAAVELFSSREDNLRLYKGIAVLCAAQIVEGSLAYVRWFVPSAEKRLALDLFGLLEGARLESLLSREFRGLAAELTVLRRQAWNARSVVGDVNSKDALVEGLLQHLLLGSTRQELGPAPGAILADIVAGMARRPPEMALDTAHLALGLAEDMRAIRGAYHPRAPVPHWPEIRPELVLSAREKVDGEEHVERGAHAPRQAGGARPASESGRPSRRYGSGVPLRGALPRDLAGARAASGAPSDEATGQHDRRVVGSQPPENALSARAVEPSGRPASAEVLLRQWAAKAEEDGDGQVFVYDEWDCRIDGYCRGACLLRQEPLPEAIEPDVQAGSEPDPEVARQIRRQFERMRPERRWRRRELDGEKIDLDAAVEAVVDRRAGRSPEERLYIARSERVRDISVALLVDLSASTETWVKGERRVVDVEREALLVIAAALEAAGDSYAIYGFSSRVEKGCAFYRIKGFGEKHGPVVRSRIQVLTGRGYTRMGVPVRHVTRILTATEARVKLMLVLSDGKPNELGIYQGQYAVEDTRQAVLEARARGVFPFGLTIDRGDRGYLPRIFGPNGYAVIDDVLQLPARLAAVYRRLTT
ncbi:MAG: hypothetical protein EPO21_23285 [Chloroflexota bacterium]|nr:MAG: hypothetical protein EPO21_23285 [Chloroflexota bacterium]